ncbi:S-layer homology domain-containing protein [Cohnella sp. GCM10027633]|uniref:S-layer homology domain-containing protein n=1 Tax=unclassified Cohnella TaxID=2636738 RepID=UPI00362AAEF9
MGKIFKARRWTSLLLAATLAIPAFGASIASADPVAVGQQDYFQTRYAALQNQSHVFETVTYYELDYLLRNASTGADDNYIVLFGGSWQPETQAAIGYINEVAKEYGITSIKNFDTKLDGPDGWVDITKSNASPNYPVSPGGTIPNPTAPPPPAEQPNANKPASDQQSRKDFSRRYVDLAVRYLKNLVVSDQYAGTKLTSEYTGADAPGVQNARVVGAPYLFIYNRGNAASPIVASLEGISSAGSLTALQDGSGADAYKAELRELFDSISEAGTKNAKFKTLTNQEYVAGSYNEFRTVPQGQTPTPVIFDSSDPAIVIDSVTLDEFKYLLNTEETHAFLIGCAWCGDTQGIVKYVNQVANEFGITKVYNFDTKLDGGIGAAPAHAQAGSARPAWGDIGGNFLQTRDNSQNITPIYTNLISTYFPNLTSENTKANASIYYFPDQAAKDAGTATKASRIQAPYVLVYDKRNRDENDNWAPILGHVEFMGYWRDTHSNVNAKNLKRSALSTLFSRLEWKPSGLTPLPPTSVGGADGKIEGIAKTRVVDGVAGYATRSLEYRKVGDSAYAAVPTTSTAIEGLTSGKYEVRYASKFGFESESNNYQSYTTTVYPPGPSVVFEVPYFQAAPAHLIGNEPTTAANTDGSIVAHDNGATVDLPSGLEYKSNSQSEYTPVIGSSITGLVPGTYQVRVASKIVNGDTYAASAAVNVTVPGYKELSPPSVLGVVHPTTLDNNDGQITGLTQGTEYDSKYKLEYKKNDGEYGLVSDEAIAAGKIVSLTPGSYSVRYAVYEDYNPSIAVDLVIKANVAAPSGLAAVAPTTTSQNNGKITGVNSSLEYRSSGSNTYVSVSGTEISPLLTGSYYVRVKETAATLASADTVITVPEYVAPNNGNNGGNNGGNTGGSSGGTTTAPNTGVTDTTNGASAAIEAKKDEATGSSIALVTPEAAKDLLNKAKQAESEGKKPVLEIKVGDAGQTGNVQVTVPRAAFDELVNGTGADIVIDVGYGKVSFDAAALKQIGGSTDGGDISFILIKSELTAEGKEVLGDRPVYDLLVYAGQTGVTSFGGSEVQVSLPYTLKPGEDPNAVVVYYVTEEGELQIVTGKYNAATQSVEFGTTHFSQYIIGYNKIAFSDVESTAWYAQAVSYLAAREITSGTDDTHFSPNATVTRGQFIVLLLNAYGIAPDAAGASNFADAGDTYYTGYLAAAKRLGIANGFEGNRFSPNATISRQDLFTLLHRALKAIGQQPAAQGTASTSSYSDASSIPSYAQEAFDALVGAGAISGSNGKLNPGKTSSRAEVAQVLYRLLSQ